MSFDDGETLHETYISAIQKEFGESTVLLVDDSETIAKNCSVKPEGLCKVHDGSTGAGSQTGTGSRESARSRQGASNPFLFTAACIQAWNRAMSAITWKR